MLQNSDSLKCVRGKRMRMFIFYKLGEWVFLKGVVNIGGGKIFAVVRF